MTVQSEQLGARIKSLRLKRYPTESARAFARRAGVNYAHLSKIEGGKVMPTVPVLEKLAGGLGVELADLLATTPGEQ